MHISAASLVQLNKAKVAPSPEASATVDNPAAGAGEAAAVIEEGQVTGEEKQDEDS